MCDKMAFQKRDIRAKVDGDRGPGISERKLVPKQQDCQAFPSWYLHSHVKSPGDIFSSIKALCLKQGMGEGGFFFGLRCARCNNCGSHGVMLY